MDNTVAMYIENYVYRHIKSDKAQLTGIARDAAEDPERDPRAEVEQRLDEWEEKRPGKFREDEPIRGEGAFSKAAWAGAGVVKIVWVTYGESCPFCNQLAGKVIDIQNHFVEKGSGVTVEGEDPLIPSTNIGHPPLHQGCDCGIAAVIGG
jgi:hypothetical protein